MYITVWYNTIAFIHPWLSTNLTTGTVCGDVRKKVKKCKV